MSSNQSLRTPVRFVSGHNKADGTSIFESAVQSSPISNHPGGMQIAFCYGTQGFPIDITGDNDVRVYEDMIRNPPGILVPNGSAARVVDFPPGYTTQMHRSMTLNYNFVIEGEVELILDSGEKRILRQGDMLVQRAINHAWRNTSQTAWARITAVVLPIHEFQVTEQDSRPTLVSRVEDRTG